MSCASVYSFSAFNKTMPINMYKILNCDIKNIQRTCPTEAADRASVREELGF